MSAITVTAGKVSANQNQGSDVRSYVVGGTGVTVTVGMAVYIDSNNQVQPAIGNVLIANARAAGVVVNLPNVYGETSTTSGNYASVCVFGPVYGFSGLTTGQPIYVSKTVAGGLDDTKPTSSVFQFQLARAIASDTIFVDPGVSDPVSN